MFNYSATSIEKQPMIIPGFYKGIWSAYTLEIIFDNGNKSELIKLDNGIRGFNHECEVEVLADGTVHIL